MAHVRKARRDSPLFRICARGLLKSFLLLRRSITVGSHRTQNLLEEADSARVRSFVYTRTTSVFGDALIPSPKSPAAWFTEDVRPVIGFTSTIVLAMNFGGGLAGACIGGIMAYALVKVPAGVFDPPPEALTVPWVYLVLLFVSAIGLTTAVVAAHLQDLQSKSVVGELRSGV